MYLRGCLLGDQRFVHQRDRVDDDLDVDVVDDLDDDELVDDLELDF